MINTIYLERPLTEPSARELDFLGPEYEEVSRHIGRANYVEAALTVERLFKEGIFDVRLLGYFMLGVFTERQLGGLPLILECLVLAVRQSLPNMGPRERKAPQLDSALRWFFGKVVQHVEHFKRDKDPRYEQWQQPEYAAVREAAITQLEELENALHEQIPSGRAERMLRHVRTLLAGLTLETSAASPFPVSAIAALHEREERLIRLSEESQLDVSSGTENATEQMDAAQRSGEESSHFEDDASNQPVDAQTQPDVRSESECVTGTKSEEPSREAVVGTGSAEPSEQRHVATSPPSVLPVAVGEVLSIPLTPALKLFLRKLSIFESLCSRKQFRVASLLAMDLREMTASSVLRQFFPTLLAGYFRALLRHATELTTEIAAASTEGPPASLAQQALRDLYLSDLDVFLAVVEEYPQ